MAPVNRLRSYGNKNTSILQKSRSVSVFNDLFAKNIQRRLKRKPTRHENIVPELPPRTTPELTVFEDTLHVSTEDTFDKLRRGPISNNVNIVDSYHRIHSSDSDISKSKINISTNIVEPSKTNIVQRRKRPRKQKPLLVDKTEEIAPTLPDETPESQRIEESLEVVCEAKDKMLNVTPMFPKPKKTDKSDIFISNSSFQPKIFSSTPLIKRPSKSQRSLRGRPTQLNVNNKLLLEVSYGEIQKWDIKPPEIQSFDVQKSVVFPQIPNSVEIVDFECSFKEFYKSEISTDKLINVSNKTNSPCSFNKSLNVSEKVKSLKSYSNQTKKNSINSTINSGYVHKKYKKNVKLKSLIVKLPKICITEGNNELTSKFETSTMDLSQSQINDPIAITPNWRNSMQISTNEDEQKKTENFATLSIDIHKNSFEKTCALFHNAFNRNAEDSKSEQSAITKRKYSRNKCSSSLQLDDVSICGDNNNKVAILQPYINLTLHNFQDKFNFSNDSVLQQSNALSLLDLSKFELEKWNVRQPIINLTSNNFDHFYKNNIISNIDSINKTCNQPVINLTIHNYEHLLQQNYEISHDDEEEMVTKEKYTNAGSITISSEECSIINVLNTPQTRSKTRIQRQTVDNYNSSTEESRKLLQPKWAGDDSNSTEEESIRTRNQKQERNYNNSFTEESRKSQRTVNDHSSSIEESKIEFEAIDKSIIKNTSSQLHKRRRRCFQPIPTPRQSRISKKIFNQDKSNHSLTDCPPEFENDSSDKENISCHAINKNKLESAGSFSKLNGQGELESKSIQKLAKKDNEKENRILTDSTIRHSSVANEKEVSVDEDCFVIPKSTLTKVCPLKAGKSWRRSYSQYKRSSTLFTNESKPKISMFEPTRSTQNANNVSSTCRFSIRVIPISVKLSRRTSILESYAHTSIIEERLENGVRNLSINPRKSQLPRSLSVVTAREVVLRRCGQTEPLPFETCYPNSILQNCQKIGEGVYGEVFLYKNTNGGTSVMKVIPIEGDLIVNDERQKKFEEIISEIVISMELSGLRHNKKNNTNGFAEVQKVRCVRGRYPERLLDLWSLYEETRGSENDSPEIFGEDQLYIVLELANAGKDLEAYIFNNAQQAYSMFKQVAYTLAVAENELKFEHRDLHWGNVLLSTVDRREKQIFKLDGHNYEVNTYGVSVAIIDFTLSRIEHDGCVIFNDLSLDPDLFTAEGDYQFEIYRQMQKKNGNQWHHFEPYTNLLWLHYILDKAVTILRYKNKTSKLHKQYITKMCSIKNDILNYNSVKNFVLDMKL